MSFFAGSTAMLALLAMKKGDQTAKSALNLFNIAPYQVPCSDMTSCIKKHLFSRWQHL